MNMSEAEVVPQNIIYSLLNFKLKGEPLIDQLCE